MVATVVLIIQGPFLGTFFSMMFYGMLSMQIFAYIQHYPRDRPILKSVVAIVWFLETIQMAFSLFVIEHYLINNYNNPPALATINWSLGVTILIGVCQYVADFPRVLITPSWFVIAYIVNLCFIWRIYILSQKTWIAVGLVLLSTVRVALGLENGSSAFIYTEWEEFRTHVHSTMIAGWSVSLVVDCAIATAVCYYLYTRRTGMGRTDSIIKRLLVYTINTGAITSLLAVVVIITFLTTTSDAFIAFVHVQSKFYAISLLATLTSRKAILHNSDQSLATFDNMYPPRAPHAHLSPQHSARAYPLQILDPDHVIEIKQEVFNKSDQGVHAAGYSFAESLGEETEI